MRCIPAMLRSCGGRSLPKVCLLSLILSTISSPLFVPDAEADDEPHRTVIGERFGADGEIEGTKISLPPAPAALGHPVAAPLILGVGTLREFAPPSRQLNIVFLSEGYLESELPAYRKKVNELVDDFFSLDLYSQYAPFFNVYRVDVPSVDSGISDDSLNIKKNTAFAVHMGCYPGFPDVYCIRDQSYLDAGNSAPGADVTIIVANTEAGRADSMPTSFGGSRPFPRYTGVMVMPGRSPYPEYDHLVIAHELGHLIGKLEDEYTELSGSPPVEEPNFVNLSIQNFERMRASGTKWARWLGYEDPTAGIGPVNTFEGARYSPTGIYRPTETSLMRELLSSFNAPSKEAMIAEIGSHIDPINAISPDEGTILDSTALTIDYRHPDGLDFHLTWTIDGVPMVSDNGFFIPGALCPALGTHTVEAVVFDNTKLVRDESLRGEAMAWRRNWTLTSKGCNQKVFVAFLNGLKAQLTAQLKVASSTTPRTIGRRVPARDITKAAAIFAARQQVINLLYNINVYSVYVAPNDSTLPKLFRPAYSTVLFNTAASVNLADTRTADRVFRTLSAQVRTLGTVPRAPRH